MYTYIYIYVYISPSCRSPVPPPMVWSRILGPPVQMVSMDLNGFSVFSIVFLDLLLQSMSKHKGNH